MKLVKHALLGGAAVACLLAASPASALTIILNDVGGVTGTPAEHGFAAAAAYWERVITTNVKVNLNVGFAPLGDRILGSTGATFDARALQSVEARIQSHATSSLDALASTHLPTLTTGALGVGATSMITPGYTDPVLGTGIDNAHPVYDAVGSYTGLDPFNDFNNSVVGLTTANGKALGYVYDPAQVDAEITFSSTFPFDFDPRDGIADLSYDFIGVAIHEMGHALGFVSGVDDYDFLGLPNGPFAFENCGSEAAPFNCSDYPAQQTWWGEPLDLYRYSADPFNVAPGNGAALDWTPGVDSYFSVDSGATNMGFFSTGAFNGDGSQASHWIDNKYAARIPPFTCSNVVTPPIGIMNPTVGACEATFVTALDLAAFDAIGWNLNVDVLKHPGYKYTSATAFDLVPEPSTWAMMLGGLAMTGALVRRRRPKAVPTA